MSRSVRLSGKACVLCHKRKVRCDLGEGGDSCTNCLRCGHTCRPHVRKRIQYSVNGDDGTSDNNSNDPTRHNGAHESAYGSTAEPSSPAARRHLALFEAPTTAASPRRIGTDAAIHGRPIPGSDASERQIATSQTYLGRSGYLRGDVPFTEDMEEAQREGSPSSPSVSSLHTPYVRFEQSHELPPRSIRASLIDTFMERCHPWMPIVERPWLEENGRNSPSLLLLYAVFLGGSRVSSGATGSSSSQQFYERAKALFFYGSERNAVLVIVAACLLNWWSPTGPEQISLNTSGFWVSAGTFLAYQVGLHIDPGHSPDSGLRRRLWWTLRARDSLISVAVGRPRIINAKDSDVRSIALEDFPTPDLRAHLFCAYAPICTLLGDIAEAHRRRALSASCRSEFEKALLQWARAVSPPLRIFHLEHARSLASYNFEAWQLWVPYLVSVIILQRNSNPKSSNSTACLLASSLIAGIFEDFLSRDHVKLLPPVWAFYALAAGLCQLTGYRYVSLQATAEREVQVMRETLEKLGERWGSAKGAFNSLVRAETAVEQQMQVDVEPEPLSPEMTALFDHFGPSLCRMWHLIGLKQPVYASNDPTHQQSDAEPGNFSVHATVNHVSYLSNNPVYVDCSQNDGMHPPGDDFAAEFDHIFPTFETAVQSMGSWLFDSFDLL